MEVRVNSAVLIENVLVGSGAGFRWGRKVSGCRAELMVVAVLGADEGGLEALESQREEEGGCEL
ncbi:activating signal cointegrator 1 complex subunit 2 [Pyrus ussuriensis x Pyrus communis]|uniref:Activating signal cointegrator 1 complex subunit 2 n=1 Tax=Pyrus ussuriensis x Pyrus communis TaxID=2448454 RepID=A0A5N5FAP9_9ROSA|nr:activating signal cointegrator 1 complex subunit 2 [Pyrus ussuriensis x Pyrus communis]